MNNTAIVPGSLAAVSQRDGISIAESFLNADSVVLVDVSGSMGTHDSRGQRSRFDVALEELAKLQKTLPGKIAVVAFSSNVEFVPGGVPPFLNGGTNLHDALQFVKVADGTVSFVLVSDGEPDSPAACLRIAQDFKSTISTVYTGPEGGDGADFLVQLAKASGGQYAVADKAQELASKVETMMLGGGK